MKDLPAWCAEYIGIPYVKGGRSRQGVDCFGLVMLVQRERFGVDLSDYDGPLWEKGADHHAIGRAAEAFAERFIEIAPGDEQLGDGVLFRVLGVPLHLGLVIAPGLMLHIEQRCDSVVESYRRPAWERRVVAFHRAGRA